MQQHHDVGVLLDRAGFSQIRIIGFLSWRCSGPRFSWLIATTGTLSSFAKSFIDRENSLTSCCRLSTFRPDDINCR